MRVIGRPQETTRRIRIIAGDATQVEEQMRHIIQTHRQMRPLFDLLKDRWSFGHKPITAPDHKRNFADISLRLLIRQSTSQSSIAVTGTIEDIVPMIRQIHQHRILPPERINLPSDVLKV